MRTCPNCQKELDEDETEPLETEPHHPDDPIQAREIECCIYCGAKVEHDEEPFND